MNANSKPPAPATTINHWLDLATARLSSVDIPSARLDAELLLAHVLEKSRTWLIAHGTDEITDGSTIHAANTLLTKRLLRAPLAYLTGHKEFYGREFIVNEHVLIPRPETETLIEIAKRLPLPEKPRINDVGTGSGCIAITLALELPTARVTASDISPAALKVAQRNTETLGVNVEMRISDLLGSLNAADSVDMIAANLPYVDPQWERSPETDHEPSLALFANDRGLALINKLIEQAVSRLAHNGYLLLEADPEQHEAIKKTGAAHGLRFVEAEDYIVVLQKP